MRTVKPQPQQQPQQQAARDFAAEIEAATATRDEAEAELSRRRNQLAEVEATADRAKAAAAETDEGRRAELIAARLDNDPAAQARLSNLDEQAWRAERERLAAEATAVELRRTIAVLEQQHRHACRELAHIENRAGQERIDAHRAEMRATVEQLIGQVNTILSELEAEAQRSGAVGLSNTAAYGSMRSLAGGLQHDIWKSVANKLFRLSWQRPDQGDMARVRAVEAAEEAA